jgi:threonine/homoserine/homoserine lactone efflux protein
VLRTAVVRGARLGAWAAAGSATGLMLWGTATVVGVAALLTASATAFSALKLAGVVYLVWLAWQTLRAAWRGDPLAEPAGAATQASASASFRQGLLSDLTNVKVGLFWTALVPQFMDAGDGYLRPLSMAMTMAALDLALLAGYSLLASRLRGVLTAPRVSRWMNGTVGSVFAALAAKLAMASRSL